PAHPALGTEPEIHAEGVPFLGHRLEGGHDVPRHGGEVVAVREAALRSARGLPVLSIDEDAVDVGGIVKLIAAELTHADDGEAGVSAGGAVGRAAATSPPCHRRTVCPSRSQGKRVGCRRSVSARNWLVPPSLAMRWSAPGCAPRRRNRATRSPWAARRSRLLSAMSGSGDSASA